VDTPVMQNEPVTISLEDPSQTGSHPPPCFRIGIDGIEELLPTWQEPSDAMNLIDSSQAPFGHSVLRKLEPQSCQEPNLSENPASCRCFEPNQFRQNKCVHCSHVWQQHKSVISDDHIASRLETSNQKKDPLVKEKSKTTKPPQSKKETYTPGDEWYNECGSFYSQGEDSFKEMVMFPIPACPPKVPEIPVLSKIVNLIDFDECDVPVDISPCQRCLPPSTLEKNPEVFVDTPVMQKEPVTIQFEIPSQTSSYTLPCHRFDVEELQPTWQEPSDTMNLIECGQADIPFGHLLPKKPEPPQSRQGPKFPDVRYTQEHLKLLTSRNEEDLEKQNRILLQQLADANELKNMELSFARDEVEDKQRMINELSIKSREAEDQLCKFTIICFRTSWVAEEVKALENLRTQLDERETLLDYRESEVRRFDDAWRVSIGSRSGNRSSSGGRSEKRYRLCCKSSSVRESFSSMCRSIFSKQS